MRVRVFRRLAVAGLVLAEVFFGPMAPRLGSVDVAYAQSRSEIVVEGNRRVEADTIRSYFKAGPNGQLDAVRLDQALKNLYATGLFADVRIAHSGNRLVVTVVENQVINRIAFEGNHKAKDDQLTSEIQSKARGTFSPATVQSDVQRIIDIYQRSGRYDVKVVPKVIELPNNRVDLVFEIDEGGKTGVQKIVFVGNNNYSDYRLKDVIKTGETNFLSFLKSNDFYDSDRIEADRDLLRKFYLKSGFADVRVVSAVAEYDPGKKGFVITFTIEEGERYHFGSVDIRSSISTVPPESERSRLKVAAGDVYNADAVEKSVEAITIDIARRGYPFATVRPRGERDFENRRVSLVFQIDEGPHTYIERINIRGNTRTRDYVVRREFDIVEGDAYNRALVDRAERKIKNLGFFKSVKITTEPGSAPDRLIVNVDLEEQSTGEVSVSGGFSSADGLLAEIGVGERNLLGTGQAVHAGIQYGQHVQGFNASYVEPYLLGYHLALGIDFFVRKTTNPVYTSYSTNTIGGSFRFGIPITDNVTAQLRYSIQRQEIDLPLTLRNCNNINPDFINTFPTADGFVSGNFNAAYAAALNPAQTNCYQDGEASLAVRKELAAGPVVASSVGYSLIYSTLDSPRSPTSGIMASFAQDVSGLGGDVQNIKSGVEAKMYNELVPDLIGMARLQAGYGVGWGGQTLRMLDHYQGGPSMVRGFTPLGFGPRDLTPNTNQDALGGSMYWAATYEIQMPILLAPKDFGMRLAFFADAGQVLDYVGPTSFAQTGETICQGTNQGVALAPGCTDNMIRSSVGVGLLWDSPIGPLRFDLAYALTKQPWDHTQIFRFGGGTKF